MSDSTDLRQRAKSAFQHAKQTVGVGDAPLATEVGGRVEAVREALRAFGEGDHDRFLSALAENVDWVAPRGENFPGGGTCDGRAAVKERFIGTVERSYTEFGFTPEKYLESPEENVVVVVGAFGGQGVKGPSEFDAPCVQMWEFDGDKVIAVEIFADSDAFPEAVGEDDSQPGKEGEDGDAEEAKGSGAEEAKGSGAEEAKGSDEEEDKGSDAEKDKGSEQTKSEDESGHASDGEKSGSGESSGSKESGSGEKSGSGESSSSGEKSGSGEKPGSGESSASGEKSGSGESSASAEHGSSSEKTDGGGGR